jgi:hypothetical protein
MERKALKGGVMEFICGADLPNGPKRRLPDWPRFIQN